jgi:hypothetical protein
LWEKSGFADAGDLSSNTWHETLHQVHAFHPYPFESNHNTMDSWNIGVVVLADILVDPPT